MRKGLFGLAACLLAVFAVPAMAQSVPAGSYLSTCRDVQAVAGWLKATCQDQYGRWVDATAVISACPRGNDIANENGRLVCRASTGGSSTGGFGGGGAWGGERPPSGTYMSSCRDIRMVAGWLKASCQNSRGQWVDATTAASWCSQGRDIANVDGQLTCR